MAPRVAINGFGRVGRAAFRSACAQGIDVEWVAINDLVDPATLGQLLRRDTVYGRFERSVDWTDSSIIVDGHPIAVFREPDPAVLPWEELGVDVVIESSGRFRTSEGASRHQYAGAKKIVISAPAKDATPMFVLGVNFDSYDPEHDDIVSNASCTTNCLAPVAKVLHEAVGIRHGSMTTVHAFTADQRLVDQPHQDLRRARAASLNMIPTTTGAAKSIGLVIPELEGRLSGYAVRVPVVTGSLVDLTFEAERPTSVEEINRTFRDRADREELEGILAYTEEPFVSTDVIGSPYSAVVDAGLTTVVDGTNVKVVAWYDNEWGYSTRLVELAERVLVPVAVGGEEFRPTVAGE